ncbi:MAG: MarC family protein [Deltaproteobacteria bacterium]|nr:MarC family protein [Deltaproteobacteria bacterium]MBI4223591.1 MarC family protein [Deltaproteobacteria bacterium]
MKVFLLCFIPLFIAIDPLGVMPIFLNLTQGMARADRERVLFQSVLTALLISLVFLLAGLEIFRLLGIGLADFQIAGGVLLLVIAIMDLIHPVKEQRQPAKSIGIVPIGIPLIMGPAALTTVMMLANLHLFYWVAGALLLNLGILTLAFYFAGHIESYVGINGMKAFSKIISLFLAAIAVMFIRVGLQSILQN